MFPEEGGGVGGRVVGVTPIFGLCKYVSRDRVWFLRFSIHKYGIMFVHVGIVVPVWSLDRVPEHPVKRKTNVLFNLKYKQSDFIKTAFFRGG